MLEINKFRPKNSVAVLRGEEDDSVAHTIKAIAFAELCAWACLGQSVGRKSKVDKSSDKRKRFIRTKIALRVRHLVVAMLIDRELASRTDDKNLELLLAMMVSSGGFRALVDGKSTKDIIDDFAQSVPQLKYVQEIVRYLVRDRLHSADSKHRSINHAKEFVEKFQEHLGCRLNYKSSKISQIWEQFAPAAPYIFALLEEQHVTAGDTLDADSAIEFICRFASGADNIARVLGRAAWIADLLSTMSRNQRVRDFEKIDRKPPTSFPFTDEEQQFIAAIDFNAPIAEHWRSRSIRR